MTNSAPEKPGLPGAPMHSNKIFSYFMLGFLIFALILGFMLVEPFMHTIIFSTTLAIIFSPVYSRLSKWLKGRTNVAAALTVAIIVFALILPLSFLVWGLVTQGLESFTAMSKWADNTDFSTVIHDEHVAPYLTWLQEKLPFLNINEATIQAKLLTMARGISQQMLDASTALVGNLAKLLLRFFLMVFMLFYFLVEGTAIVHKLKYLAPLRTHQEDFLIESLQRVTRAVLFGSVLIAILQGLVGGLGLYCVGIPPLFWGTMMAMGSFIPVLGTGLIWMPASAYLFFFGDWRWALFLLLWNVLIVTNIDTILRPMLMRKAAQVSPFYIFLSILGGIHAFGALGIFYGPLILSFLMVMLTIYSEEYKEVLTSRTGYQEHRNEP